ncbi:MAG: class I SAM-dependent methyltransferase, partial [Acidobacteria bacterium]|nr:class I SAM-dependent methyltransferase [Acidobacteriota bacterium]
MARQEEPQDTPYTAEYGALQSPTKGYSGFVTKLRVALFLREIQPKKDEQLLEIGCNDGVLLGHMARYSGECYGIDVNEEVVRRCNTPRIQVMSATELGFPAAAFDTIYSCHAL